MLLKAKKMQTVVVGFKCDRCGKELSCDGNYEYHEALHIDFVGGYGSVFGDGTEVQCDLCQNCLQDLIKDFCRVKGAAKGILKHIKVNSKLSDEQSLQSTVDKASLDILRGSVVRYDSPMKPVVENENGDD